MLGTWKNAHYLTAWIKNTMRICCKIPIIDAIANSKIYKTPLFLKKVDLIIYFTIMNFEGGIDFVAKFLGANYEEKYFELLFYGPFNRGILDYKFESKRDEPPNGV